MTLISFAQSFGFLPNYYPCKLQIACTDDDLIKIKELMQKKRKKKII